MAYRNRKKNYPLYETTRFDNFRTMTEQVADRVPNDVAFRYKNKPTDKESLTVTYAEARQIIRALSTEAYAMGMSGKTVALVGEASVEWFLTYIALGCVGAVSVPVDKELPAADIAAILNTAECEFLFLSPAVFKKRDEILAGAPSVGTVISLTKEGEGSVGEMTARGKERVAAGDRIYFDYEIDNDALSSIVFTSGTTGKGKGVMLSQKNICSDMEQGMYNFDITRRTMFVLPPHHTFGSTVNFIGHFSQGCEIDISSGLRYIMNELAEYKPTHLILVPLFVETFYKRIMAAAEKGGKREKLEKLIRFSDGLRKVGIDLRTPLFRSVRAAFGGELGMIICGGAALSQNVIDFFESIGITILNGYGITECAPLISANRNEYRKQGSVGTPIVGGEVKIVDPDENGEGEIAYRGPNVMLGYYKNEEATRAAFDGDGWFLTGDYGRVEVEGGVQWITITGRLKNLIIFSNGKNVYPEEIEAEISGIPGVGEVVVYAGESKSDPEKEIIVAEIYPDAEALERRGVTDAQKYFEDAVKEINQKTASYKAVGKVKLRDTEFEKNTSKKIIRFAIDKTVE